MEHKDDFDMLLDGFEAVASEAERQAHEADPKPANTTSPRKVKERGSNTGAHRKAGRPKSEALGARHTVYVDDDAYTLLLFYKAHQRKAGKDMTLGEILSDAINEKVKRDAREIYDLMK